MWATANVMIATRTGAPSTAQAAGPAALRTSRIVAQANAWP
jgi:hypothetical protein